MKLKLTLFLMLSLSVRAFSQTSNNISIFYGPTSNTVNIHGAIGDFGYASESGHLMGFSYTADLTRRFSLETGLEYSSNNVQMNYILPGRGTQYVNGSVKLLTLPILARRTFFKYVFIDGGLLLDHETNYSSDPIVNDQSGLGLELGFGGKYNFGGLMIFVNPFFRVHSLTSPSKGDDFNLMEDGVKFGLGYNF